MQFSNRALTAHSQSLRRNMTKEERHLWYDFLKDCPYSVKRQHVIDRYIVDFYCPETKTAIELDGSQHYEDRGKARDSERDEALSKLGISVLRYSNADVNLRFSAVCEDILRRFGERGSRSLPLTMGEGGAAKP